MEPNEMHGARVTKAKVGLLLFALVFSFGIAGTPKAVNAQWAVADAPVLAALTGDAVEQELTDVLLQSATLAVVNATNYFASQIAYQAALAITSDCPGQKNCWSSKAWGQNFREAGEGFVGEAVGSLSEGLFGNDFLCSPNALFTLSIQLGLMDDLKPDAPRCDFNAIVEGWGTLINSVETGELLESMIPVFEPGQSPIGMSLDVMDGMVTGRAKAEQETIMQALTDAGAGGGFSPITDLVSGRVKSPQSVVESEFRTMEEARKKDPEARAAQYNAASIAGRAGESVALNATQVFVQTLVARLWNKLVNGLLSTEELLTFQPDIIFDPEAVLVPGRSGVQQALQTRFVTATTRDAGAIDPLLDFISCPGANASPNNCVMDAQFANAVRLGDATPLTIGEALEKGMLHKDWPLIPSSVREKDRDNFCYTYGYCESNLKKLRASRIIPIGWEIAAAKSPASGFVTLGQVVAGFNDCNAEGESDARHPWCHLIDPSWVLKAPPTQCRAMVSGPTLLSSEASNRADTCVDSPTCLRQDDFGACIGGWGYCLRERTAWRFQGDQCAAQFNSCRTLTQRDGNTASFLMNTVSSGVCNAENVGCTAYALNKNLTEVATDPSDDWSTSSTRFLNREAKTCSSNDNGCTALVPLPQGTSLNLVRNGSFEFLADGDGNGAPEHPEYWSPYGSVSSGNGTMSIDGAKASSGANAMRVRSQNGTASPSIDLVGDGVCSSVRCTEADGCTCTKVLGTRTFTCGIPLGDTSCSITDRVAQDGVTVRRGATYTVSATFMPTGTSRTVGGRIDLRLVNATRSTVDPRGVFTSSTTVSGGTGSATCIATAIGVQVEFSGTRDEDQKGMRASCSFVVDASISSATIELFGTSTADMYVDDVQLEEGTLTAFHEKYGSVPPVEYRKMAPSYLGCTGEATDRPECAGFTQQCRANEVGCTSYTPMNGDPAVPAIAGPQDFCPAECSGYDTYKQEATDFDTEKFPVFFIPSTASQCSEAESGCSQFTDVQTEEVAYYSKLRLCDDPSTDPETVFYSWEGSDTAGFQLRVWNLKKTTVSVTASASDIAASGTAVGFAPCTKLGSDATSCASRDSGSGTDTTGLCTRADIDSGNFDCREFYDADGNRHFRLLSKTILLTAECRDYRITTSTQLDCEKSNGRWLTDRQQCVYSAHLQESVACAAQANGCRPYKGNASGNVRTILHETFEGGTAGWSGGELSEDSIVAGGHSYRIDGGASMSKTISGLVAAGRSYTVSFWAHGNNDLDIDFAGSTTVSIRQNLPMSATWREYTVGPVQVTDPTWGANVTLRIDKDGTGGYTFIDNIILKEVQDNIFVVRDSWRTPLSCDSTAQGIASPQEMLGCKQYARTSGSPVYLRSFATLCREQAIGCSAYSHTQNSVENPYAESFNAVCELATACTGASAQAGTCRCDYTPHQPSIGAAAKPRKVLTDVCRVAIGSSSCRFHYDYADDASASADYPDRVNMSSDRRVYIVPDEKFRCGANALGCREFGVEKKSFEAQCILTSCSDAAGCDCTVNGATCTVARGQNTCTAVFDSPLTSGWDRPFVLDNPATYERSLCLQPAVSCEEFRGNDGTFYFKHPKSSVCVFKEGVMVDGESRNGWFRKTEAGIDAPCNPELLRNGEQYGIAKNADPSCDLGRVCTDPDGCACDNGDGNECLVAEGREKCGYQGWVGECSPEVDRCEEFIDPATTTPTNPLGTPYYYLLNNKIDLKSCSGGASLDEGCIMFQRTNNPARTFNAATTYEKSEASANGGITSAVNCNSSPKAAGCGSRSNDTNIIIKVRKDRECAQWLACSGSDAVWDESNGQWKNVCTQLDACEQQRNVGDSQDCSVWADVPNEKLTEEKYTSRDVSYPGVFTSTGFEYSGYSLPGKFPVQYVSIAKSASAIQEKLYGVPNSDIPTCIDVPRIIEEPCEDSGGALSICIPQFRTVMEQSCSCPNGGIANGGKCFVDLTGVPIDPTDTTDAGQCRGYPEQDAPFNRTVLDVGVGVESRKSGFRGANVCTDGNVCECSYVRTGYGTGGVTERFYSSVSPENDFEKICVGGPNDGESCEGQASSGDNDDLCNRNEGGTCVSKRKLSKVVGWEGYCVDPDYSFNIGGDQTRYACNLWMPVDRLPGAPDLNNQERGAGWIPTQDYLYCSVAAGSMSGGSYGAPLRLDASTMTTGRYVTGTPVVAESTVGWALGNDHTQSVSIKPTDSILKNRVSHIRVDVKVSQEDVSRLTMYLLNQNERSGSWVVSDKPLGGGGHDEYEYDIGNDDAPDPGTYFTAQTWCDPAYTGGNKDSFLCIKANWNDADILDSISVTARNYEGGSDADDVALGVLSAVGGFAALGLPGAFAGSTIFDNGDNPVVTAQFTVNYRETCEEIAHVGDPDQLLEAVAWTNRIRGSNVGSGYDYDHETTRFGAPVSQQEFGRIVQSVDTLNSSRLAFGVNDSHPGSGHDIFNWPLLVGATEGGSPGGGYVHCPDGDGGFKTNCDCASESCSLATNGGGTASGIPYACVGDCRYSGAGLNDSWDEAGTSASRLGLTRLSQVFARVYGAYEWNSGDEYDRKSLSSGLTDFRATYASATTAPQVRSVNTQACVGSEGNCPEGPAGLTVNNFMRGNVTGTSGKYRAVVKFYAWADKDHMPIRDRTIDFGDGSLDSPDGNQSYYKNHRGCKLKADGTCDGSAKICAADAASAADWGVHPDACTTGYFSISHTYICSKNASGGLTAGSTTTLSNCATSGVVSYPCKRSVAIPGRGAVESCVFKPRVRAVDNWGQCNGTCPGGAGSGNVCINGVNDFNFEVGGGECKGSNQNSWTPYDGEIILAPR